MVKWPVEVTNSTWVRLLGQKGADTDRHFMVRTYDDIFDVLCTTYEFKVQEVLD